MPSVLNPHYPRRLPVQLHQRLFPALSWGKSQLPRFSSIVISAPAHVADSIKTTGITGNLSVFLMPSVRVDCMCWNARVHLSASRFLICNGHVLGNKEICLRVFFPSTSGSFVGIATKPNRSWLHSTSLPHSFFSARL